MKVRIEFTVDVPDEYRRVLNAHFERPGLASRQQVKDWYRGMGEDNGDALMGDMLRMEEEAADRAHWREVNGDD